MKSWFGPMQTSKIAMTFLFFYLLDTFSRGQEAGSSANAIAKSAFVEQTRPQFLQTKKKHGGPPQMGPKFVQQLTCFWSSFGSRFGPLGLCFLGPKLA